MSFIKAALAHWKTTTAGLAAALLIVVNSYHSGMSWKQWGMAAAVALMGITAHDADATPPDVAPTAAKP